MQLLTLVTTASSPPGAVVAGQGRVINETKTILKDQDQDQDQDQDRGKLKDHATPKACWSGGKGVERNEGFSGQCGAGIKTGATLNRTLPQKQMCA